MVNIETYDRNDCQTRVKEDYPVREWVTINDNQRLSNGERRKKIGRIYAKLMADLDEREITAI